MRSAITLALVGLFLVLAAVCCAEGDWRTGAATALLAVVNLLLL